MTDRSSCRASTAISSAGSTCIGFLAQIFAVSRVIKVLGVGGALFVHPVIALVGYSSMIWAPVV